MIRKIAAVVIGLIAGGICNMLLITLSHAVYPLPEGLDPNDMEALSTYLETNEMPTGALLLIVLAHSVGSLVSGLVCGLIAGFRWYAAAAGLGLLWTVGGISMLMMLPSPLWFAIVDLVLYIPAALLGVWIGGGSTAERATLTESTEVTG